MTKSIHKNFDSYHRVPSLKQQNASKKFYRAVSNNCFSKCRVTIDATGKRQTLLEKSKIALVLDHTCSLRNS